MERIENKLKLSVCEAIGKKVQKMTGRAKEKEPVKMIEKWKSLKCVLYVIVTV